MLISLHLPSLNRFKEWELKFSIERDGCSMSTFYNCLQDTEDCVILIQDENDAVFGAYTEETWQ